MFYSKLPRPRILFNITRVEEEDVKPSSRMYGGNCDLIRIVWTLISGVFNIWRSAVTESILNFWDNELRTVYTKDALSVLNSGIYIINKFIKFGSYVTCTLRGLLIQMQSISLRSSHMRKSKILRDFWGLQVTQQSWLLLFASSPPLFFRSPCLTFFLLLGV